MLETTAQSATPNPAVQKSLGYQYFDGMTHLDLLMMMNSIVDVSFVAASNGSDINAKQYGLLHDIYKDLYKGFCDQMEFAG